MGCTYGVWASTPPPTQMSRRGGLVHRPTKAFHSLLTKKKKYIQASLRYIPIRFNSLHFISFASTSLSGQSKKEDSTREQRALNLERSLLGSLVESRLGLVPVDDLPAVEIQAKDAGFQQWCAGRGASILQSATGETLTCSSDTRGARSCTARRDGTNFMESQLMIVARQRVSWCGAFLRK